MLKKITKLVTITFFLGLLFIVSVIGWRAHIIDTYRLKIHNAPEQVPATRIAIVLGAAAPNGQPSDVLQDRLNAAISLYNSGKAEKLLLSGDNRVSHYNEPEVMYQYALAAGIPEQDLIRDYAGRRTYDTCYRARHIFQVQEATLVTNEFHLPRSIYLCETLGITSTGLNADNPDRPYLTSHTRWWNIRETLATTKAFIDLNFTHPTPILGDPLPIE